MKAGTLIATCGIIVVNCASGILYGDVIFNSLGPNGEYVENISFGSTNGILDPIITNDVDYAARFVIDQGELYNNIFITVPFFEMTYSSGQCRSVRTTLCYKPETTPR